MFENGKVETLARADVSKIKRYGWKPKLSSAEAVRLAVKENLRK